MPETLDPQERLQAQFDGCGSVCVALSGGVDSSVVLAAAVRGLGPARVAAFTASSPLFIAEEAAMARTLAAAAGVRHVVVALASLDDPRVAANSRERCYYCKAAILDAMLRAARDLGCETLADGANADDVGDDRPGMRAAAERGVRHPLLAAGVGKAEVRELARAFGLPTAASPQQACLASRVPYGEPVSAAKLVAVAQAEAALHALGFRQCRVRHHGSVARIEVEQNDLDRALERRREISTALHAAGFAYVSVDLDGFRSGSMNEA